MVAKVAAFALLLASASAFSFGKAPAKKAAAATTNADGTVATPGRWKWAFGDFAAIQERQAARAEKKAAVADNLVPTPLKFQFAFGKPEALAARRAERLAKWEWSDSFLARARPDLDNYGAGEYYDDGLTTLERNFISQGKEAYLTGAAKLRLKSLRGEL